MSFKKGDQVTLRGMYSKVYRGQVTSTWMEMRQGTRQGPWMMISYWFQDLTGKNQLASLECPMADAFAFEIQHLNGVMLMVGLL